MLTMFSGLSNMFKNFSDVLIAAKTGLYKMGKLKPTKPIKITFSEKCW